LDCLSVHHQHAVLECRTSRTRSDAIDNLAAEHLAGCATGMASPATWHPVTTTYSVICFLPLCYSSTHPSRHLVCAVPRLSIRTWIRTQLHTHFWTVASDVYLKHVRSLQAPASQHGSALTSSSCALTIVLFYMTTVHAPLPFLSRSPCLYSWDMSTSITVHGALSSCISASRTICSASQTGMSSTCLAARHCIHLTGKLFPLRIRTLTLTRCAH